MLLHHYHHYCTSKSVQSKTVLMRKTNNNNHREYLPINDLLYFFNEGRKKISSNLITKTVFHYLTANFFFRLLRHFNQAIERKKNTEIYDKLSVCFFTPLLSVSITKTTKLLLNIANDWDIYFQHETRAPNFSWIFSFLLFMPMKLHEDERFDIRKFCYNCLHVFFMPTSSYTFNVCFLAYVLIQLNIFLGSHTYLSFLLSNSFTFPIIMLLLLLALIMNWNNMDFNERWHPKQHKTLIR